MLGGSKIEMCSRKKKHFLSTETKDLIPNIKLSLSLKTKNVAKRENIIAWLSSKSSHLNIQFLKLLKLYTKLSVTKKVKTQPLFAAIMIVTG